MKRFLILLLMLAAGDLAAQTLPPQRFAWTRPTAGEPAVSYVVQTRENSGPWVTAGAATDTFYVFDDLLAASSWEIRVAGVDGQGRQGVYSLPSLPIVGDEGPPGPPGVPELQTP
ncbi:MAG: fibronectin type III domain-containing protein [bacterium]|nr:fibronectin type III domain-containing protein [bacterium]